MCCNSSLLCWHFSLMQFGISASQSSFYLHKSRSWQFALIVKGDTKPNGLKILLTVLRMPLYMVGQLGSSLTELRDLLLTILSTSLDTVMNSKSDSILWIIFNDCLTVRRRRSQAQPMWSGSGCLNLHSISYVAANSRIASCFNSVSAPLKLLPQCESFVSGWICLLMNRSKVFKKELVSNDSTTTRCIARVVIQIKRLPQRIWWARPISTNRDSK